MKEKELKDILRKDFNFEENWKPLFSLLFNKVQYFSNPSNPFSENEKVKSGKQTGIVKLDDGKSIAIFEVEVDDTIHIDKKRQGLREIAIKHIDQNITHGAFVFFYSKNQADYRFSFIAKWSELDIETGEFKKGETKPKRYTYLLGVNEACTTAAKRLLILIERKTNQNTGIKEIIDAFSVESLNKEFFKTYKEHYEKFWRFIANPDNGYRNILLDTTKDQLEKQEKPIRDFAKKLLGRIVFLHFLQKKGWMGCSANTSNWVEGEKHFMQKLFTDFSDKTHFHSRCLTKLFFNTLNSRENNEVFELEGLHGKLNGSRVPYLNGGLFDTDKPKEVLTIDFPEKYFAELLEFFEQYNFTIDENSPDDHEVGIDPEMLGHIFENLLEENREKGAFYTPKEVVQYMCKESLIQYLNNSFDAKVVIEKFVRNHIVSETLAIKDNAVLLNNLLDKIKICDPAIGSGAFPIGILQEIFEAKKFIYPYLKTNKEFNPAQVKKDIIQKSIYGVDLEKGAVDIAQLRFWLALVVDEENPHPLPNLDYKIMQGNSLLESFEGIDLSKTALLEKSKIGILIPSLFEEPNTEYGFSDENRAEIQESIRVYFKTEDKREKTTIRKNIDRIVIDHIDKSLEFYETRLLFEIADIENRLENKIERLTDAQKEQYKAKSKEVVEIEKRKKLLANRNEARKKLLEFEHTDERPYFLWHLFFMDVFEKGGFDVIIGNPPYRQLQKMGIEADILENEKFETFTRTGDLYCLFYEKGFNLLKKGGTLTYITSNSWMKTKYGESLRKFFVKKTNPLKLLNFEDTQIFPSATVETNILIGKSNKNINNLEAVAIKQGAVNITIQEYFNDNKIEINELDETEWIILSKEDFLIKEEIERKSEILDSYNLEISRGIVTGFNEAFIIPDSKTKELIEHDDKNAFILKKFLGGRDIHKYKVDWNNEWLIYSHSAVNENDFPEITEYLSQFRQKLEARRGGMNTKTGEVPYKWWQLQVDYYSSGTFKNYELPKLMWAELSDKQKFVFDASGIYPNKTIFIITGELLKPLLVVLNSKVVLWFFNQTSTTSGMGTTIWSKYKVEKLPIPKLLRKNAEQFSSFAEYLILLNDPIIPEILEHSSNQIISETFEEVLNMMVYELIFEEHLKEKEIDVLRFVNFPNISKLKSFEEKRDAIQKIYFWLKEKDNPIRNRILVSESRSWIIKRINQSTH
ncbi:MAG TPA: Eco57I restriction-modification methylase domain-containing protein [Prolixibacteraceae bacterium]